MTYEDSEYYLVEGSVLNRILAIASRINTDNAFAIDERRDLAQEIQAKLAEPEGPVDIDKLSELAHQAIDDFLDDDPDDNMDGFADGCAMCGGELVPVGNLGDLEHYRCRDCGFMSSAEGQP